MALWPDEMSRWAVRPLGAGDQLEVLRFLERDPVLNAYLISRMLEGGISGLGTAIGIFHSRELVAVAMLGSNVVLAAARDLSADVRNVAVSIIAEEIIHCVHPPRAMVSEVSLVDGVWAQIRDYVSPPTVVRLAQPVYVLDSLPQPVNLERVRYSTLADLDQLVPACAAMHLEEVGIDPLSRDASGYRQRIRELVLRSRSLVLVEDGEIVSKAEYSAVTPYTVQLMGVWTHPAYRRRGYAKRAMTEICGHILSQRKRPSLFVNDFNVAAIRLYESLGFRMIGTNRALIW
jgi:predicted GNAT family acetyltransferase